MSPSTRSALVIVVGVAMFSAGVGTIAFGPRTVDLMHVETEGLLHSEGVIQRAHPMAWYLMGVGTLLFAGGLVAFAVTKRRGKQEAA